MIEPTRKRQLTSLASQPPPLREDRTEGGTLAVTPTPKGDAGPPGQLAPLLT